MEAKPDPASSTAMRRPRRRRGAKAAASGPYSSTGRRSVSSRMIRSKWDLRALQERREARVQAGVRRDVQGNIQAGRQALPLQ